MSVKWFWSKMMCEQMKVWRKEPGLSCDFVKWSNNNRVCYMLNWNIAPLICSWARWIELAKLNWLCVYWNWFKNLVCLSSKPMVTIWPFAKMDELCVLTIWSLRCTFIVVFNKICVVRHPIAIKITFSWDVEQHVSFWKQLYMSAWATHFIYCINERIRFICISNLEFKWSNIYRTVFYSFLCITAFLCFTA